MVDNHGVSILLVLVVIEKPFFIIVDAKHYVRVCPDVRKLDTSFCTFVLWDSLSMRRPALSIFYVPCM